MSLSPSGWDKPLACSLLSIKPTPAEQATNLLWVDFGFILSLWGLCFLEMLKKALSLFDNK